MNLNGNLVLEDPVFLLGGLCCRVVWFPQYHPTPLSLHFCVGFLLRLTRKCSQVTC